MQKILNKLAKKKPTKLSKRQVKLGQVDDMLSELETYASDYDRIAGEIIGLCSQAEDLVNELRVLQESKIPLMVLKTDDLIAQVSELGIETPEVLQEVEDKINRLDAVQVEAWEQGEMLQDVRLNMGYYIDLI